VLEFGAGAFHAKFDNGVVGIHASLKYLTGFHRAIFDSHHDETYQVWDSTQAYPSQSLLSKRALYPAKRPFDCVHYNPLNGKPKTTLLDP